MSESYHTKIIITLKSINRSLNLKINFQEKKLCPLSTMSRYAQYVALLNFQKLNESYVFVIEVNFLYDGPFFSVVPLEGVRLRVLREDATNVWHMCPRRLVFMRISDSLDIVIFNLLISCSI